MRLGQNTEKHGQISLLGSGNGLLKGTDALHDGCVQGAAESLGSEASHKTGAGGELELSLEVIGKARGLGKNDVSEKPTLTRA
jgi:hypothetical protein